MASWLTKLMMDTHQFDNNVKGSRVQMEQMLATGKMLDSGVKTMMSTFTKVAGTIGLATGAVGVFNDIMKSSQGTSDAWDNAINTTRDTLDTFYTAVSTFDFSAFEDGIFSVIGRFYDLSAAIDVINDAKLSLGIFDKEALDGLKEQEIIFKDQRNSQEERTTALAKYNQILGEMKQRNEEVYNAQVKYHVDLLNTTHGVNASADQFYKFLRNQNNELNSQNATLSEMIKEASRLRSLAEGGALEFVSGGASPLGSVITRTPTAEDKSNFDAYMEKLSDYAKGVGVSIYSVEDLKREAAFRQQADTRRKDAANAFMESYEENRRIGELTQKTLRVENSLNKNNTKELKEQTKEAERQLEMRWKGLGRERKSVEQDFDAKVSKQVNRFTMEKKEVNPMSSISIPDNVFEGFEEQPEGLADSLGKSVRDIEEQMQRLEEAFDLAPNNGARKVIKEQIDGLNAQRDAMVNNVTTGEAVMGVMSSMGNVMGDLGGMLGDNGGEWMKFGGTMLSTISTVLPQLASLAGAQWATSITGQGAMPFPMNLISIGGTVAAMVGALASMPKFAFGGIVPGGAGSGDRVLVRANPGEMILNGGQQKNLFNAINSGSIGGGGVNGEVTFRIRERDLVGVMKKGERRRMR